MNTMKILLIAIITFLWTAPNALAFYEGEDKGSEESNQNQSVRHQWAYDEMMAEKKRIIKEAVPKRKKRKRTLSPFIHDIPQEPADLSPVELAAGQDASPRKNSAGKNPTKGIVQADGNDIDKEISKNILINLIVLAVCACAFIFFLTCFHRKKLHK